MGRSVAPNSRRALLDAALACFLEDGVVDTTLDELLTRSGASVGSLYHHFGGKEQLADALYVECLSAYHAEALEVLVSADSAEAGVRGLVEYHIGWIVEHTDRARFLLAYRDHEIRPASDELRGLNARFFDATEHWIRDRAVVVPLPPLPAVISQWIGPVHNFSRHWLTSNITVTPAEAGPLLSDGAWSSLKSLFTP